MENYKKQNGASMPLVILFVAMSIIILTILFKLYPAYYEYWQVKHVLEGFEDEPGLDSLSVNEIKNRFDKRIITNNIREFDSDENLSISKNEAGLLMDIEYEVRIPIYDNIDAVVSFKDSWEKQF
jgi:hypothetical protein